MNDTNGVVEVGRPPRGFQRWESVEVYFHDFAALTTASDVAVESPEFACLGHRWRLGVYPGGFHSVSDAGMVAATLCNMTDEAITLDYFFTVRNPEGEEVVCSHDARGGVGGGGCRPERRHMRDLFAPHGVPNWDLWVKPNFAARSTILDALVEGTLIVEVRMKNIGRAGVESLPFVPHNPLRDNVLRLFLDEESADVAFEVSGGGPGEGAGAAVAATFHAHRLIVKEGAPVLDELCKLGDGAAVVVADVRPGIFRLLLYYAYGGRVAEDEFKAHARELLDAADKFGMVHLKLEAEVRYVKATALTVDNVLDNLLYADSKNCAYLKEVAMDYIVENRNKIIGQVCFADVPGSMMTDLLTAMARETSRDDRPDVLDEVKDLNTMRVEALRRMLHDKGLEVDGSREAMVALLKDNCPHKCSHHPEHCSILFDGTYYSFPCTEERCLQLRDRGTSVPLTA